jgi:hypothetical protein
VLDVAPTLLYVLGQAVGDDMPGRILPELIGGSERLHAAPAQHRASYEKRPQVKIPYRNGWPSRKFRPLAVDR